MSATHRLHEIPLFAELSDAALARVADIATEIECPAGTVLAVADDPGSGMFVVEEGTVVVEARGGVHIELGPGEFVGELTLLVPDAHRIGRIRAATDVRCLAIRENGKLHRRNLTGRRFRFAEGVCSSDEALVVEQGHWCQVSGVRS